MDLERLEEPQDENNTTDLPSEDDKASDVSGISSFHKLQRGITNFFARLGLRVIKVFAGVLLALIKSAGFVCSELKSLILALLKGIIWLGKALVAPFGKRMKFTAEMQNCRQLRNLAMPCRANMLCQLLFNIAGK